MSEVAKVEPLTSTQLRDELKASLGVRRELGEEMEDEVIESFLARIQDLIDKQVDDRVAQRLRGYGPRYGLSTGRIAVVLFLSIPLMGIAGSLGGLFGILAVVVLAFILIIGR